MAPVLSVNCEFCEVNVSERVCVMSAGEGTHLRPNVGVGWRGPLFAVCRSSMAEHFVF